MFSSILVLLTCLEYASYAIPLSLFLWIACIFVNTQQASPPTTIYDEQANLQARANHGSEPKTAVVSIYTRHHTVRFHSDRSLLFQLLPVAPLTFRAFKAPPVSVDDDLARCLSKLSMEDSSTIAKSTPIVSLEESILSACFAKLSVEESAPEPTQSIPELEHFDKPSIHTLSPKIARSVCSAFHCPKSKSPLSPEIIGCFERLPVEVAPKLPRSKAPIRRSIKKESLDVDDYKLSPIRSSLPDDFIAKFAKVSIKSPAHPPLRSCFQSQIRSRPKKSVHFNICDHDSNIVYSELKEYEVTLSHGQAFQVTTVGDLAIRCNTSGHYPHVFGKRSILPGSDGKVYLLKELGTFNPPSKQAARSRQRCGSIRKRQPCFYHSTRQLN
jgi:hypothetical protein